MQISKIKQSSVTDVKISDYIIIIGIAPIALVALLLLVLKSFLLSSGFINVT